MSRKAQVPSADVASLVRGAIRGGLDPSAFIVERSVDGTVRLLPTTPGAAVASPDSGEAEWDKALGLQ